MPLRLDVVESSIEGDVKCDMHSMNLMLGLNELRLSGQLLDVTLLAEKKPFQVKFVYLISNYSTVVLKSSRLSSRLSKAFSGLEVWILDPPGYSDTGSLLAISDLE